MLDTLAAVVVLYGLVMVAAVANIPTTWGIPIPTGEFQGVRLESNAMYTETWFMNAPHLMYTIPQSALYAAVVLQVVIMVAVLVWLRQWLRT